MEAERWGRMMVPQHLTILVERINDLEGELRQLKRDKYEVEVDLSKYRTAFRTLVEELKRKG
jgi:soluble cytochrome b562